VLGRLLEAGGFPLTISLDFVTEFADELLDSLNRANPPVYAGRHGRIAQDILAGRSGKLFPPRPKSHCRHRAAAIVANRAGSSTARLGLRHETTVGIATAPWLNARRLPPHSGGSPPHLSQSGGAKFRRQVPVPGLVLTADTLVKLLETARAVGRTAPGRSSSSRPVRMRMGFHWKPVVRAFGVTVTRVGRARIAAMSSPTWRRAINPVELEAGKPARKVRTLRFALWTLIRPPTSCSVNARPRRAQGAKRYSAIIGEVRRRS